MEPSPQAASSWFSLISDHARSYSASLVSKLRWSRQQPRPGIKKPLLVSKDGGDARLLYLDAGSRQAKRKKTAIAHDAKVGGRGNSHPVVVIGRVLDGIRIETPCPELKHSSHVEGDWLCRPCDWIVGF